MTTLISIARPKFFTFFRIVCIFLGGIGIIGSAILLLMSTMPQMKAMVDVKGGISVSDMIWIMQSLTLIVAGIWIFKLKEIGRISILICVSYSLIMTIYYYLPVASTIPLFDLASLLVISLCLINALIFIFFMRRDVKVYIKEQG